MPASKGLNQTTHYVDEDMKHTQPAFVNHQDGWYACCVCLSGMLCNLITYGCMFSYGLFLPAMMDEFGKSRATTALVGSIGISALYCLSPFAAKLYNRFGPRKITIFGSLLCTLGLGCTSAVSSLYIMFLTHGLLAGFGACCVQISVLNIVPRYFKKRASLALGLLCTGYGAGLLIFSSINGACLKTIGWRGAYLVMAGAAGLIGFLGIVFKTNMIEDGQLLQINDSSDRSSITRESRKEYPRLCRNYLYIVFALLSLVAGCSESIIFIYMGKYGEDIRLSVDQRDALYQTMGSFAMIVRLFLGYLLDRFDAVTPLRVYRIGVLVIGLSAIACPFIPTFYTMLGFVAVFGFFYGAVNLSFYAITFKVVSLKQRSMALGFITFVSGLGYLVGPPLAGFLVDQLHSNAFVLYLAGGMEIMTFLMTFLLELFKQPTNRRELTIPSHVTAAAHQVLLVVEKLTAV